MQWLALIIPFVIAILYKVKAHRDVTWLEYFGALALSVTAVITITTLYTYGLGKDEKLVSGYVTGKQFIPEHQITVCVPVSYGKNCTTTQCHQETVPDKYSLFVGLELPNDWTRKKDSYNGDMFGTEGDHGISISKKEYTNLILGDYSSWLEYFDNPLRKSKSSLYRNVDKEKYPIVPTPEIYERYKVNRLTILNSIVVRDINPLLQELNSKLNYTAVNCGVIITTYPDDFPQYLENSWHGGNPNDFVVVIGVDDQKNIKYVDTVAWGNEYLKIKVKDDILNKVKNLDKMNDIPQILYDNIKTTGFTPADFSKFNYIKTQFPMWLLALTYILTIIVTVIYLEWSRGNEYTE